LVTAHSLVDWHGTQGRRSDIPVGTPGGATEELGREREDEIIFNQVRGVGDTKGDNQRKERTSILVGGRRGESSQKWGSLRFIH